MYWPIKKGESTQNERGSRRRSAGPGPEKGGERGWPHRAPSALPKAGEASVSEGKRSRGSHLRGGEERACADGTISDKESVACSQMTLLVSSRRFSPTCSLWSRVPYPWGTCAQEIVQICKRQQVVMRCCSERTSLGECDSGHV